MRTLGLMGAVLFAFLCAFTCGTGRFAQPSFAAEINTVDGKPDAPKDLLLEIDGDLYDKDHFPDNCSELLRGGKCDAKSLGTMHLESRKEGSEVYSKTTFADSDKTQVVEQSWEQDGHVRRISSEYFLSQKIFELEVKNGKVFYKITDKTDGSVKAASEDAVDNLVVPSTIMRYMGSRLNDLSAGKEVTIKVAAIDRQESFTFNLKKVRTEKTPSGDPILVIELKASSIFVRSVVSPMYLFVTKDGELAGFEGKSPLRRKEGDHYQDFTARVGYRYGLDLLKPDFHASSAPQSCNDNTNKAGMTKCEIPSDATPTPAASSSTASPSTPVEN